MKFSIIGDPVNLASRLEGACKFYGVNIIVSHATKQQAKGHYLYRTLDNVVVVGKTQDTWIYELLGEKDSVPEDLK